MATSFSFATPNLLFFSPFPDRTRTPNPFLHRTRFPTQKQFLRGSACVPRYGFKPGLLPDSDTLEMVKDLFGRAEGLIYTIADAAVSNSEAVDNVTAKQNSSDWLSGITYGMESVLKVLKDGLSGLHVPYTYGFAIILLTVIVKAATFPLSKKQVESAMAMKSLQPQIKAIQERYAGNKSTEEKIQLETARLYKLAGINPLAGCLPTFATIPVWIGLYRALSNVADEGLLTEGFFWIPTLAGPTTIASRQNGSGISWLFPFIDGHPPLGWPDTLAYLVLPVMLVALQYISLQIMQPSQSDDPNVKNSQAITKFLPLMIGYFSLSVPSGLSLYWLTNNILSTTQQFWFQKLGGAKVPPLKLSDDIVKGEKIQTKKPLNKLNSSKTKSEKVESLTSKGPRPGERFKQLKEQEERRKQQREEEQRKVREAAAEGGQTANDGVEKVDSSFPGENGTNSGGGNVVEQSETMIGGSSSFEVIVNGNFPGQSSEKDEKTNLFSKEKSQVFVDHDVQKVDNSFPGENGTNSGGGNVVEQSETMIGGSSSFEVIVNGKSPGQSSEKDEKTNLFSKEKSQVFVDHDVQKVDNSFPGENGAISGDGNVVEQSEKVIGGSSSFGVIVNGKSPGQSSEKEKTTSLFSKEKSQVSIHHDVEKVDRSFPGGNGTNSGDGNVVEHTEKIIGGSSSFEVIVNENSPGQSSEKEEKTTSLFSKEKSQVSFDHDVEKVDSSFPGENVRNSGGGNVVEQTEKVIGGSSSFEVIVNGNSPSQSSEKEEKTSSLFSKEKTQVSVDHDVEKVDSSFPEENGTNSGRGNVVEQTEKIIGGSPSFEVIVNGNSPGQSSEKDEKTIFLFSEEKGQVSVDHEVSGKDEQQI